MKRSQIVMLTLAGVSLGLTGCRRQPPMSAGRGILPPDQLPPAMRASLPSYYAPGADLSNSQPPHNAYDPRLGYYHEPCRAWFPYPYNHHDPRWGYYRCGRWSRQSRTYFHTTGFRPNVPGAGSYSPAEDFGPQPPGAPVHSGVAHADATKAASGSTHRGGFGGTGHSTGFHTGS
jgi:hypothetical protein